MTLKSITVEPESIRFSDTATITVVLTGPAPATGLDVRIVFRDPDAFGRESFLLSTLPIASGSSNGQMSALGSILQANLPPNSFSPPGTLFISAFLGGAQLTAPLHIVP